MSPMRPYQPNPLNGIENVVETSAAVLITGLAIRAVAGYLVGNLLGHPVAGAAASTVLGVPGLLGVAIYSKYQG